MGRQFGVQIDTVSKEQLEWVPRSVDANGGGPQGMRLVGSVYGTEVWWTALAITDTAPHASPGAAVADPTNPTGTPFDAIYAVYKTALVVSTLNEAVTLQPTASWDGVTYYPVGSAATLPAGTTDSPAATVIALSTPALYVPYVGLTATCATAPTSGSLSGTLARLG